MSQLSSGLTLEQILSNNGILRSRSPSGWYTLKCPLCLDKKTRGGWKFEDGSGTYHCFNCAVSAGYRTGARQFSDKMVTVLTEFGILDQCKSLLFSAFASDLPNNAQTSEKTPQLDEPAALELPTFFRPLDSSDTEYWDYLRARRLDDTPPHTFMVTDKKTGKWCDRLIVISRNSAGQPIFFQGRDITGSETRLRWESPVAPKTNIMFNFDVVRKNCYDSPVKSDVIICEGAFDALSVQNGLAILGSSFSKYHIHKLKQLPGRKILVPNKDGNGKAMAEQALSAGFLLSFPDIGSCGDLNEARCKYGSMYLEQALSQGVVESEFSARMKLGHWVT